MTARLPTVMARVKVSLERHREGQLIQDFGWKTAERIDPTAVNPKNRDLCYRIMCGFGWPPNVGDIRCPERLGIAYSSYSLSTPDRRDLASTMAGPIDKDVIFFADAGKLGVWTEETWRIHNERGLQVCPDGYVEVMDDKTEGRRPLGKQHRGLPNAREWDIIGDRVMLPAIVVCPRCQRPNQIELPEGASAWRDERFVT